MHVPIVSYKTFPGFYTNHSLALTFSVHGAEFKYQHSWHREKEKKQTVI